MEVTLKTFEGFLLGHKEIDFDSLDAAVRAFLATPFNKLPRLIAGGRVVLELDPECALAPMFRNREVEEAYGRVIAEPGVAALACSLWQQMPPNPNRTGPTE